MICWQCKRAEATTEIELEIDFKLQTVGFCEQCYEDLKEGGYRYLK